MATNMPISLPCLPPFPSISKRRSHFSQSTHNSSLVFSSPLCLSTTSRKATYFHNPFEINHQKKSNKLWITFATAEEFLPSDSIPLDNSQQIVSSTGDEGVATIIQALLFVAFLALTILTIGCFELDSRLKKKEVRAIAGPRGFDQKIDEDDDDDGDDV